MDTASYDIFRRDIQLYNRLPDPRTVRIEEYVNNFVYAYPAPAVDAVEPFSISLVSAPHVFNRGTQVVRIGIQAAGAPKKPTNLVFLVDRSTSMTAQSKLPLVKELLKMTLNLLEPQDTVALVTYTGSVDLVLAPTSVKEKSQIISAIDGLVAQGVTNGGKGIQLAYEQARAAYVEDGINHVILCTDGDFNVGVTSTDELIELIRAQRDGGITFTALGFGRDINDEMLEAVSNAGDGTYAVISTQSQASDYVKNRLLSNIVYVAKDTKVQVEFNPQLVSHYRLIGYENREIKDDEFREDEVDAGEIGTGHRVTALYELILKDGVLPNIEGAPALDDGDRYDGPVEVASEDYLLVKIRYKQVGAAAENPAKEVSSSLKTLGTQLDADADLRWAAAIAAFAEILRGSPFADRVSLEQIGLIFAEQSERDEDRAEFYQLFQRALPKL